MDIVDPDFADDITITPEDMSQLDLHAFQVDVHLMTNDPVNYLAACAGVPGIHSVIAQLEHMSSQKIFLDQAAEYSYKIGLALDLTTPLEAIVADSWKRITCVQVMGIKAGSQGQSLVPTVLPKIQSLKQTHSDLEILVDGGVKPENFLLIRDAGASGVAVGSYLWESENLAAAIAKLEQGQ